MSENTIYELLTDAVVPGQVIESLKDTNFWVKNYLTDNAVIDGSSAEYYSSNPAPGVKYTKPKKKKMEWDEDKVYKCSLPVMIDEIFQCKITKDMLRIATGSEDKAEMIAALQANNLRKQLDLRVNEECVKKLCDKDEYSTAACVEVSSTAEFLEAIFNLAEQMKHPSDKYNRGYKKKDGNFEATIYASGPLKFMTIVLDTGWKTKLRMEGSKTLNYSLVDLEEEFKAVHDVPLPNNAAAIILGEESFAMNWQIAPKIKVQDDPEDPLAKKVSLPGFIVGGPITFANKGLITFKKASTSSSSSI
ncbi:MAG: hypothetical protein MRERV_16c029 [Mycoplasmataceae bacterium RV_VA103A]|nr:MAG: hypothetical protein MRERV_16c029 [Mycoplasmataceae bacterium RV_VA103A]